LAKWVIWVLVLTEQTGPYHKALEQYLLELDIPVYMIHVQERPKGMMKTDKRDAQRLANTLYNQLEKGVQVTDKTQLVHRAIAPSETAIQLRNIVRHRSELMQDSTRRKNKLTSICDELFPELTKVYKDPNSPSALTLREKFPTPLAVATASRAELNGIRRGNFPSEAQLIQLQQLAGQSIGIKNVVRQRTLILEQKQLINELRLIQEHAAELEAEIRGIVENSREGKILLSIPPIGPVMAATIIAAIGHIDNFSKASELKSYFGWAPKMNQTGTSYDRTSLSRAGTRSMKNMMYLIVWKAIELDTEWAHLYQRLVPVKCSYDERRRKYIGARKVIGRIAGQMISLIYALLKKDQEVLSSVPHGSLPPEPTLYDPALHKAHRQGQYAPSKPKCIPTHIILLPKN
jgi:transposase